MKKLLLLISLLLATNAWGEEVKLSCEASENTFFGSQASTLTVEKEYESVVIWSLRGIVTVGDIVLPYEEAGNIIRFKRESNLFKFRYSLDRISGKLEKYQTNKETGYFEHTIFKCKKAEPLF